MAKKKLGEALNDTFNDVKNRYLKGDLSDHDLNVNIQELRRISAFQGSDIKKKFIKESQYPQHEDEGVAIIMSKAICDKEFEGNKVLQEACKCGVVQDKGPLTYMNDPDCDGKKYKREINKLKKMRKGSK